MGRKSLKSKMNELRPVMAQKKPLKEKPVAVLKGDVVNVEKDNRVSKGSKADRQIVIMADVPADKQMIRDAAKKTGMSMSKFILRAALAFASKQS